MSATGVLFVRGLMVWIVFKITNKTGGWTATKVSSVVLE